MTKKEIAFKLSMRIPRLNAYSAVEIIENLYEILSDAFVSGESVFLRGFGTFQVKQTKEKPARNISTGEQVLVPSQRVVRFRPCASLKERMKKSSDD